MHRLLLLLLNAHVIVRRYVMRLLLMRVLHLLIGGVVHLLLLLLLLRCLSHLHLSGHHGCRVGLISVVAVDHHLAVLMMMAEVAVMVDWRCGQVVN